MQINAGSNFSIFEKSDLPLSVHLIRIKDKNYWNGSSWSTTPVFLTTTTYIPGIQEFITPKLKSGQYLIIFYSNSEIFDIKNIYAGGFLYNSSLNTCIVYGTIKDISGQPVENSTVYLLPNPITQFIDGNSIMLKSIVSYTNNFGEFAVEAVRGSSVIIKINDIGFNKLVTIPNKENVSIEEL